MFYFDKVLDKTVLKSDKIPLNHFFTTKELLLKTKEPLLVPLALNNREIIKNGFNLKKLATPSQRHTSNVEFFDFEKESYPDTDGLILKEKGAGIFLNFADCTPIVFYDPVQNVAGISHAGWRGTVQKIGPATVLKMNSDPKNVIALIGPSICFKCFETSEEIMNALAGTIQNKDGCFAQRGGKFYADLKEINRRQLLDIGVEKIDVAPFCTCCDNDKFFSYRKENKTTNRMSAFICLN